MMHLKRNAAAALLMASVALPSMAQQHTNEGIPYLLSQSKDVSQEFSDFTNTYFFADSLVSLDAATGQGVLSWKRHLCFLTPQKH